MKRFPRLGLVVAALLVAPTFVVAQSRGPSGGSGGGSRMGGPSGGSRGGYSGPRGGYSGPRGGYSGPRGSYSGSRYAGPRGGAYAGPRGGAYVTPRGYGYGRGWYGGYGGYYRPGWGYGWGWGGLWGFSPWWGWGGYYAGYPSYGYGYGGYGYAPGGYVSMSYSGDSWAGVKTDVSPEEARVFLDGRYIGLADDFDGFPDMLYLQAKGRYQLEFRLEGFESQTVDVDAEPGALFKLDNKLKKIPGAKQYGSYDTPEPEGGLQRFFGKSKGAAGSVSLEGQSSDAAEGAWRVQGSESGPAPATPPQAAPAPAQEPPAAPRAPAARGRIVFRIQPADAAVYLDDTFAGTGEELSTLARGLQVAAGPHRVVVSRPGFATDASIVDVSAGSTERVEISLQRP